MFPATNNVKHAGRYFEQFVKVANKGKKGSNNNKYSSLLFLSLHQAVTKNQTPNVSFYCRRKYEKGREQKKIC